MNLNKVLLIGRLVQDVELKYLPSGTPVASLVVATNRVFKDKNNQTKEETEFHPVIVWGQTAENCKKFLTKGRLVYLEGRLRTRTWTDQNGVKHYRTEIIAERIQFGPRPRGQSEEEGQEVKLEPEVTTEDIDITEIPY